MFPVVSQGTGAAHALLAEGVCLSGGGAGQRGCGRSSVGTRVSGPGSLTFPKYLVYAGPPKGHLNSSKSPMKLVSHTNPHLKIRRRRLRN